MFSLYSTNLSFFRGDNGNSGLTSQKRILLTKGSHDRDMKIVAFLLNFVNNFDFGQNLTVLTQSNF